MAYWDKIYLDIMTAEPQGTQEIAKKLKCYYDTALSNLIRLRQEKKINGKKLNGTQWVWWKLLYLR